jgi:rhamnose utilization protein RhaD (predicted bifunctional aldolase and dehydrogenase)
VLTGFMKGRGGKRLAELAELSACLGSEPLLVQGSTGNTSVKTGRMLWIKASGKWLANATSEDIFVPVPLGDAEQFLALSSPAYVTLPDSSGLTPSIETAMHLVLPHRIVIHLHSVNTIAWAVQENGPSYLRQRLNGLPWCWIPYTSSGAPLARAMRASSRFSPDVFILANHGLVIGAETCGQAAALLADIEARLAIEPRETPEPKRAALGRLASTDYQLPTSDLIHSLATNPLSTAVVSGGILYPCQAMFLGRSMCVVSEGTFVGHAVHDYSLRNGGRPPALLVEGSGVLVAKDLTATEAEVLDGLAQVVRRLPQNARVQYLSDRRIDEVLNSNVYAGVQSRPPGKAEPPLRSKAAAQ